MTRKNAAAITVHSSQPPCNLWSEWRRGRARRPFRFRRKGRSLPARQIFQPRRLGASGSRGRRRRRKGLEGRRKVGEGAGLKVWGSSLVESWNRCRAWNRMLERTGRRGVIRWKETRDRRRRCTLLGDYRRSIARWISNESLKFRWNITVQLYLNPLDSNSYFRSSPWTLGRAQVPRIFDTLVQKSNSNWIFASKREREKGRKARSACNLQLVGRDAGERVPLVSRSFLNSGREERGATRSRGRGRLLATTRPFARRLGPPLLASCRPTTASVCFRALVCASSGATVALLLYRPIRTFVLAPSLSLSLSSRPLGDRLGPQVGACALCASRNFTTAGALIAGSCAIPEGCGCNFSPPWKRWNGWKIASNLFERFFSMEMECSRFEIENWIW